VQLAHAEDDQLEVLTMAEIERLPERDRRLIQVYYREDRNLSDAGHELSVGRSWACRRHALVLSSIGKVLEERAPAAVRVRRKAAAARAIKTVQSLHRRRAKRS
jgi:RNA polymerase sigma factor for flagellar operon FliA